MFGMRMENCGIVTRVSFGGWFGFCGLETRTRGLVLLGVGFCSRTTLEWALQGRLFSRVKAAGREQGEMRNLFLGPHLLSPTVPAVALECEGLGMAVDLCPPSFSFSSLKFLCLSERAV